MTENKARDVGLFSDGCSDCFPVDDINTTSFIHSLSHTERTSTSVPPLVVRKEEAGYNDFLPYQHKERIVVYNGNKGNDSDMLCGCEDYPCKTIEHALEITDLVFFIFF
jgi:hypothetical protein